MTLFHKKDKIPEIPQAPQMPGLTPVIENKSSTEAIPLLPSLPGDGRNQINRDMIKSAVEDSSEKISGDTSGAEIGSMKGFEESGVISRIPSLPVIKEEAKLPILGKNSIDLVPVPPAAVELSKVETAPPEQQTNIVKKDADESIFVRIDKFNSAKRDVQEISRDLQEIDSVLNKLEEIKMQEDEEVAEIAKVMEEVKLKMSRIDNDIFNRI